MIYYPTVIWCDIAICAESAVKPKANKQITWKMTIKAMCVCVRERERGRERERERERVNC